MDNKRSARKPTAIAAAAVALSALCLAVWHGWTILAAPVVFSDIPYTGASACQDCHTDRHQSWHRTYHRTMTQPASATSVVGNFDGTLQRAFGGQMRPIRQGDQFAFEYSDPASGAVLATLPIARTVGSHRYQQYLTRDPGSETHYRLHYLYHMGDKRWVHMNAAFLGSDEQHFDAQVTPWNANCVFCHNTGPAPKALNMDDIRRRAAAGEPVDVKTELRFATEVAELGISCEACHGPGAEHVQRMSQWLPNMAAKIWPERDRSIVNPERLTPVQINDGCGLCHAGRTLPSSAALDRWLTTGPSFRPGDALADHLTILAAHTPSPSPSVPDLFRDRFWQDGSPRLTAYEYQGQGQSACAIEGELHCITCHTMHGGDPAGMLPEANRGDAPCLRCHQDYRGRIAEHSGHPAESSGARCMACHMPRAVYGVMTIHRTHAIAVPDVAKDLAAGKPNACLNCHSEEAPTFAGDAPSRQDGAPLALADGLVALLAGDPVRQAVAAFELGRLDQAPHPDVVRVRTPWLLTALDDDRPAVRRFAWHSLRGINAGQRWFDEAALQGFDYTGAPDGRATTIAQLHAQFAAVDKQHWAPPSAASGLAVDYTLQPSVRELLTELGARSDKQIDVGE